MNINSNESIQTMNKLQRFLTSAKKLLILVSTIFIISGCATKVSVAPPQISSCAEYIKEEALTYKCPTSVVLPDDTTFKVGLTAGIVARNNLEGCSQKLEELQTVLKICKQQSDKLKEKIGASK